MLRRLIGVVADGAVTRDFRRYLLSLDGGSDNECGAVLFAAQWVRICHCETRGIHASALLMPFAAEDECNRASLALAAMRREAAAAQHEERVAGLTVWLHTLQAARLPTLRLEGRALWGILGRGIPHARKMAAMLVEDASVQGAAAELLAEVDAIPQGLEPRDASGSEYMPGNPGAAVVQARESARILHETAAREAALSRMPTMDMRLDALTAQLATARARANL